MKLLTKILFSLVLSILATSSVLAASTLPKGTPGTLVATPPDVIYYALDGDTLSSIAKKYTEKTINWKSIAKRNNISDDRSIPIGTAILIPLELLPEESADAKVYAMAGEVAYTGSDNVATTLAINSLVKEGGTITTGKNGFLTLVLNDDSRVSIPSNTKVKLAKLRKTKFTASPRTEITLLDGRVESRVSSLKTNKGRFEVTSPLAVAGVRGTHFRVATNDGGVANEVLEGGVALKADDAGMVKPRDKNTASKELVLASGQGTLATKSGLGTPVPLLPPPVMADKYQLQERTILQFGVDKLEGASAYRVQIARDPQILDVLMEKRFTEEKFKFDSLDDGQYYVRITAFDKSGIEGFPLVKSFKLKARPEPPFTVEPKGKVRATQVDFSWTESPIAEGYRLQVAKDLDFKNIVMDKDNLKQVELIGTQLEDGQYYWRAATIARNPQGQRDQGPYSDVKAFSKLPPQSGASVGDDGGNNLSLSWNAEPGQKFLLQIATDLEFKKLYLTRDLDKGELNIPRPPTGVYYIRVRATDPDGYVGPFSAAQKHNITERWETGFGEPLRSSAGVVKPSY